MIISCSLLWTFPCVAQKCSIHKLHYKVWLFLLLTIYICLHHSFTSAVSCRLIPLKRIISRKMTIVSLFIFLYFIFLVRSTSAAMVSFVGATGKWEKAIMVVFLLFCLFLLTVTMSITIFKEEALDAGECGGRVGKLKYIAVPCLSLVSKQQWHHLVGD